MWHRGLRLIPPFFCRSPIYQRCSLGFLASVFLFLANFYLLVEFGITHSLCWQEFFLQFLDFWIYFGDVPRYRFFVIFRGTKSIIFPLAVQRIVYDYGLNTPAYEFLWFSGYVFSIFSFYRVTYCIWKVWMYPDILNIAYFGVHTSKSSPFLYNI